MLQIAGHVDRIGINCGSAGVHLVHARITCHLRNQDGEHSREQAGQRLCILMIDLFGCQSIPAHAERSRFQEHQRGTHLQDGYVVAILHE
jgi:hypothetical protein